MILFTHPSGRHLILAAALAALLTGCAASTPPRQPATSKQPVYSPAPKPQTKARKPSTRKPATQKSYKVMGKWYHPVDQANGFTQTGKASWYGKKFHGRKTSNGERYDMYGLSAAHKTLPMGTWVRVNNRDNSRTLDVRINDRGPFVAGRIIDLSYGAAKKLAVVGPGTARVKITALGSRVTAAQSTGTQPTTYRMVDWQNGRFTFQVGAFKDPVNAKRYRDKLASKYKNAHLVSYLHPDHGTLHGVRIGLAHSYQQALAYKTALRQNGFPGAFTIAE